MLTRWLDAKSRWDEFYDPEWDRYCYNLPGPLKYILPIAAAGLGAFALPAVLGAGAAGAAGVGEAAGAGAAEGLATDAGLASTVLAAPVDTAATAAASGITAAETGATALGAAAPALTGLSTEAITGLPSAVSGIPEAIGAAAPFAAGGVGGAPISAAPGAVAGAPAAGASPITAATTAGPAAGTTAASAPIGGVGGGAAASTAPGAGVAGAEPGSTFFGALTDVGPAGTATGAADTSAVADPFGIGIPGDQSVSAGAGGESFAGGTGGFNPATGAVGAGANPSNPLAGAGNFLSENKGWIGPGTSLVGLGLNALQGRRPLPFQTPITGAASTIGGQANELLQQGQQLQGYYRSGTLPPGQAEALNTAAASRKAAIRSQYAAIGQTGSSAEAQDLANVDQTEAATRANLGLQLLQQGVSEQMSGINATGLDAQLYQQLQNTALQQDAELGNAIGAFGASLAPRTQVNIGGTA